MTRSGPVKTRTPAQLANDQKLRERRKAPQVEAVRTGRPSRSEVTRRARRKRTDGTIDRMAQFTLDIFRKDQLPQGYVCRWVEDTGARMRVAHQEDYDPVIASEISDFDPSSLGMEGGETVRQVVGRRENGQPIYAHLMKKHQDWFDEDQAAGVRRRADVLEGRVLRGDVGPASLVASTEGSDKLKHVSVGAAGVDAGVKNAYVPKGARIGNVGRQVLGEEARTGRVEA